MYKYIFLLFSWAVFLELNAQCPPGHVQFNSQSEVDQFIIDYPNCTVISGDLYISGGITDLMGLQNITSIERVI